MGSPGNHLAQDREGLGRDLRRALQSGELALAYQPIVTTSDRQVHAVEALLRWTHPQLGPIPAETTVRLAEESGLIDENGRWVLTTACIDSARMGGGGLDVAVNVSAHQLRQPDFAEVVAATLTRTCTSSRQVTLELTEGVLVHDSHDALTILRALKDLGVMLALDDFGTGYSSLSYLKHFPVDVVKIDRMFIADLETERSSRLIVSAIIELAHSLGMQSSRRAWRPADNATNWYRWAATPTRATTTPNRCRSSIWSDISDQA